MRGLFLPLAAAAMICWSGGIYGQQPSPPSAQRFSTCSQQLPFCNSGCESLYKKGTCRARCQERHTDCMATGFWTNPNTGEKVSRRRE
jgi:hypothetical protein